MKIAHVVDSMEIGGAETLVFQMCRRQREQGHSPSVYAIAALGAFGEQMRAERFTVQANIGRHLHDCALRFYQIFRQLRPDVVHLHNPTPTIYASLPARLAGAKRIISTRHSLVAPPHNKLMERKYAIAARFCDWVVGICDATTSNIRELSTIEGRKLVRIYNGALPIVCAKIPPPDRAHFVLLYVGRLEPIKNNELLLQAFKSAVTHKPELRLWVVGDGSQRAPLEDLAGALNIAEYVTFWGQQLDVAKFYCSADAFVMSSQSEGLPISLLQALSVGLPTIVTDVGGMGEVVRLAQSGFAVPLGDPGLIANAILAVAEETSTRSQFSANGKRAFLEHFELAAMVDRYYCLYQQ